MEENYTVSFKVHNKKTGAWANNITFQTGDRLAARAKYHSECGRLFGSSDFDFVMVAMIDTYGNVTSDYSDLRDGSDET